MARSQVVATSTSSGGAGLVRHGDDGATASPANDNAPNDVNEMHNYQGATRKKHGGKWIGGLTLILG